MENELFCLGRPEGVEEGREPGPGFRQLLLDDRGCCVLVVGGETLVEVQHSCGNVIVVGAIRNRAGRLDGNTVRQTTVGDAFR